MSKTNVLNVPELGRPDPTDTKLPKLSVIYTNERGEHSVVSCHPEEGEINRLSTADFLARYLRPAVVAIHHSLK